MKILNSMEEINTEIPFTLLKEKAIYPVTQLIWLEV